MATASKKEAPKEDPRAPLKAKYAKALFEGHSPSKPWGGLSEEERAEVQASGAVEAVGA